MNKISVPQMDLIKLRNIGSILKIGCGRRHRFLACFTLDSEERLTIPEDNKINFPFVGIPNVSEFHSEPLGVLHPVTVFEELAGNKIFESRPGIRNKGPVPEIEFPFLFYGPNRPATKGRNSKADIQAFQDGNPAVGCFVCHL